jgi:hypothetical protein
LAKVRKWHKKALGKTEKVSATASRMVMVVCLFIFISFYLCKVMSIIWYAQGKDGKTAKEGVTAFLYLKC